MYLRPIEYLLNRFSPKQEEAWIAYKAGLNLFLDWGRRSGKTAGLGDILVEDVEEHRQDVLFIAITQGQAREILWPRLVELVGDNPDWKLREHLLEAVYAYGGVITLKGADKGKDHLRGGGKRLIVCDECAFWRDFDDILKYVLIPMLADFNGQIVFTSTPKGKNHFYRLMLKCKKDLRFFYNKATLFDNPYISPEGKQMIVDSYRDEPNIYRQEILGEYVDFEGMVFAINPQRYVEKRWDKGDLDHCWHFRGLDHGYSPDPTACLWLAYSSRLDQWMIYDEYKKKQSLLSTHAELIINAWDFDFVSTQSDIDPQIIAEMNELGLFCEPTGKHNKEARMLRILQMLRSGKLKIADNCRQLLREMETYEWGQDGNDHLIDSLNYVVTNSVVPVQVEDEEEDEAPLRLPGVNPMDAADSYGQDFGD